MSYLEFNIAKPLIHNLDIKTVKEWNESFKKKLIPAGIPRNPNREYVNEWINWGDWLGTNAVAAKDKQFLSYKDCKEYVNKHNINSKDKFIAWQNKNKPEGIHSRPDYYYKEDWVSWGDFLDTGRASDIQKHENFLPYLEAKDFLKKFQFTSEKDFYEWAKTDQRPDFIPASPRKTFGKAFVSMGDFLDNGNIHSKEFLSYEKCIELIRPLSFHSPLEYTNWVQKNRDKYTVPAHPWEIYPEFEGWPEFLGYQRKVSIGEKTISSILVSNNIPHKLQYTISDCRDNKPLAFDVAIIDNDKLICLIEYQGIQHFLHIEFYGGEEALKSNQKRDKIKYNYCLAHNMPLLVVSYKEDLEQELKSFLHNLDIDINLDLERRPSLNRKYLYYETAREIVQSFKIDSLLAYKNFNNLPDGIPKTPEVIYKDNGWISWGDFLGTGKTQSRKAVFVDYEECKKWMIDNGVKSGEDWRIKRKHKPSNIPSNPDTIYKAQWPGWKQFLSVQ